MRTFEPCCLATAIQGMSHVDVNRACQVVLDNFPEIPILPNLSKVAFLHGALRSCEGMPCLAIDEEKGRVYFDTSKNLTEELSRFYERYLAQNLDAVACTPRGEPGFHAMLAALQERRPPELQIIKFGISGPISLSMSKHDENHKPIFYHEALRDAVFKALAMKVQWQEKVLNETFPGVQTIVQIGEAFLGMVGSPFVSIKREEVLNALAEIIGASSGLTFIHCCANTDWPLLLETGANAISFDAYEYVDRVALYPEEIKNYLAKGGILAWGIVPTSNDKITRETPESLLERLEASMELLVQKGIDKELLVRQALITPSCATGAMTVPLAETVFQYTKRISTTMRQRYFSRKSAGISSKGRGS